MSNDLDDDLRAALRPVDPGERFTQSVLARVAEESTRAPRASRFQASTLRWASVALSLSLALGILLAHQWQVRRTQRGLEARKELLQALQLTGEKLDLAYRVVNDKEHPERAAEPGA
jgi:hypothetical protein